MSSRSSERISYQESFAKPDRYLILEVVCLSALFDVGCCPLPLEPFCATVEDLEARRTGSLDSI